MNQWMVRIPGRRPTGPVPTELLVRGIRAGRVPPETEVAPAGTGAWQPLGAFDEFFEALGLSDAETRLLEGNRTTEATARTDDNDDEAKTRVMGAPDHREPAPGQETEEDDEDAATRVMSGPLVGRPEPRTKAGTLLGLGAPRPPRERTELSERTSLPRSLGPLEPGRTVPAHPMVQIAARWWPGSAPAHRPLPGPAPEHRATPVRLAFPSAQRGEAKAGITPYSREDQLPTEVTPAHPGLMDAVDDSEETGSLGRKARERFPSIRPLVEVAELTLRAAGELTSGRSGLVQRRPSPPEANPVERADEITAPALRLQRAYARIRTALMVVMALLVAAIVVLLVLLFRR